MADLMKALRNADAAGDTDAANRIATMIRNQKKQDLSNIDPDVPVWEDEQQPEKEDDQSFLDTAIGAGDAALTTVTGATSGLAGGVLGNIEGSYTIRARQHGRKPSAGDLLQDTPII